MKAAIPSETVQVSKSVAARSVSWDAPRLWLKLLIIPVAICGFVFAALIRYFPFSRKSVSESLTQAFPGDLKFNRFKVLYFPHPGCVIEGVTFRLNSSAPVGPPLVAIQKLTLQASYIDFLFRPHHLSQILLDGLRVYVALPGEIGNFVSGPGASKITIGDVTARNAILEVARSDGKSPLEFEIHQLTLGSISAASGMSYHVALHNPEPPGEVASTGHIGSFSAGGFRSTPASGAYLFDRADLSAFSGIAGVLSSNGNFSGTFGSLIVHGEANIPNFEVVRSGHALALQTRFTVSVDAASGDVAIQELNAVRGRTKIAVNGSVAHKDGWHGKFTSLDFAVRGGRIEDLLPIFVTGHHHPSPMDGETTLQAHVTVPPAGKPFLQELALDGDFDIADGHMEQPRSKERVDRFSASAQGEKKSGADDASSVEETPPDVAARLSGHVVLRNAVASLTDLAFSVPGVDARLHGTFNIVNKNIDLHGSVRTDATLAQQTTGVKTIFAKALDPLFRKKRGTVVPVEIDGTYHDPHFGIDLNPIRK